MAKCFDVRVRFTGWVYRIDEIVTMDGLFITWDNCFRTEESAIAFLKRKGYIPGPTKYEEEHGIQQRSFGI